MSTQGADKTYLQGHGIWLGAVIHNGQIIDESTKKPVSYHSVESLPPPKDYGVLIFVNTVKCMFNRHGYQNLIIW